MYEADTALVDAFSKPSACLSLVFFLLSIHITISAGSYSGYNDPPMFGDFEAQRHWMEITLHLPVKHWYVNGTDNDLNYWGLDYPPLTAFHSACLGKISAALDARWVALHSSRGMQTEQHKLFMRLSVLVSLWLLYIPALISSLPRTHKHKVHYSAISVLYPTLISMDNGHFQYNHISLGLFLCTVLWLQRRVEWLACVCFVFAVSFKQMELYHALPIAVFLLGSALRYPFNTTNILHSVWHLTKLTVVVVITLGLVVLPLLYGSADLLPILHRIFPFQRGIFEDKVANVWCAVNVVVKLHNYSIQALLKASTALVLLCHVPSLTVLLLRPTMCTLKRAVLVSALTFFLFSFQVHEKTILLAAIPALLLWSEHPVAVSWLLVISNASVFPLCILDGNALHLALFVFFLLAVLPTLNSLLLYQKVVVLGSCSASVLLCLASLVVTTPVSYPHLFSLMTALFCCGHFVMFLLYFNYVTLIM